MNGLEVSNMVKAALETRLVGVPIHIADRPPLVHSMRLGSGYGGEVYVHCTGCTDMDTYDDVDSIVEAYAAFADHLAFLYHPQAPRLYDDVHDW